MKTQQQNPMSNQLTAMVYNNQKDIAEVEKLQDSDQACLDEIKVVLQKYQNQEKFGITLLHKHFDLKLNEMMVETINTVDRILTTQPVTVQEARKIGLVQTVWSFSNNEVLNRNCEAYCPLDAEGGHFGYRDHG